MSSKTKKQWIYIVLAIVLCTAVNALSLQWMQPNQNGELITTYPQYIKVYTWDSNTINFCMMYIDGQTYNITIGTTAAQIEKEIRLAEGNHTVNTTCYGTGSVSEVKTFTIDNMLMFQENERRIYLLVISAIIYFILLAIWIWSNKIEKIGRLLISSSLTLIGFAITTIETHVLIWIPIGIAILLVINDILEILNLK